MANILSFKFIKIEIGDRNSWGHSVHICTVTVISNDQDGASIKCTLTLPENIYLPLLNGMWHFFVFECDEAY